MAVIDSQTQAASPLIQDAQGHIVGYIIGEDIFHKPEGNIDAYGPLNRLSLTLEEQLSEDEVDCTDGTCSNGVSLVKALLDTHQWRGKRMDATGFIHLGTRYYDPMYGRFISPDPLGHAGSIDLYSYANGDPVNFHDPDGRFASAVREGLQDNPLMASGVSMGADYIPGLSNLKSAAEVFTGLDYITGAELSKLERVLAAIGVIPGVGNIAAVLKGGKRALNTVDTARTVIGRVKDLKKLPKGEKSLLDKLPDMGNPKSNWKQNSGALRQEMKKNSPIGDKSPGDTGGVFLNAERALLKERGWLFNSNKNQWMPPR